MIVHRMPLNDFDNPSKRQSSSQHLSDSQPLAGFKCSFSRPTPPVKKNMKSSWVSSLFELIHTAAQTADYCTGKGCIHIHRPGILVVVVVVVVVVMVVCVTVNTTLHVFQFPTVAVHINTVLYKYDLHSFELFLCGSCF